MTWDFAYVGVLIVGLALAAVTGLLRELGVPAHRHLTLPPPNLHGPLPALLGRRLAVGLILSGVVGLAFMAKPGARSGVAVGAAAVAAIVGIAVATVVLRPPCAAAMRAERATVVRDLRPGAYGQVRIERGGVDVLMAARSADGGEIPAGTEVEVVDCTRSVITVRRRAA